MNKKILISSLAGFAFGIGAFFAPCNLTAAQPTANDECAKELLLSYFPEPIVTETLKRFNVPEDKWAAIKQSLAAKDKEVVKLVEKKAAAMTPNPLKDPQQRQAAVKLFRDTLLEVFTQTLKESGLKDNGQYQAMLDDIQQQKAKKFAMCMEKQKAQLKQQGQPGGESDEDEDSDNDDEDSDEDSDEDEDSDDNEEEKGKANSGDNIPDVKPGAPKTNKAA